MKQPNEQSKTGPVIPAGYVTPPRTGETTPPLNISPFINSPFPGTDAVFTLTKGKKTDAYSPNGSIIPRLKYEGPSHKHLKWLTSEGGIIHYNEHSVLNSIHDLEPILWVLLLNLRDRIDIDYQCILGKSQDKKHFHFTVKAIKKLQYHLLNTYLSCSNRDEFLDDLNKEYLAKSRIYNPFGAMSIYSKTYNLNLAKNLTYFENNIQSKSQISVSDIESVIFIQIDDLTQKANKDYDIYRKGFGFDPDVELAIEMAKQCCKNICEWYNLLSPQDKGPFLTRINQHILTSKSYNPFRLIDLYIPIGDTYVYDMANANNNKFTKSNVSLLEVQSGLSKEKFHYISVEKKSTSQKNMFHDASPYEIEEEEKTITTTTTTTTKLIKKLIGGLTPFSDASVPIQIVTEDKVTTVSTHKTKFSFFPTVSTDESSNGPTKKCKPN